MPSLYHDAWKPEDWRPRQIDPPATTCSECKNDLIKFQHEKECSVGYDEMMRACEANWNDHFKPYAKEAECTPPTSTSD